jgi:hypothetical protein
VQLPETLRPRLGSTARARTFDGATGSATLRQLADSANAASRTFEARYVLAGATARAPLGSTATVTLSEAGDMAATEVPLGALRDTGHGAGVWIVGAGVQPRITWRPVKVTAIEEETATVTSGLKSGDRFVAMGAHMLHQGQIVRVAAR